MVIRGGLRLLESLNQIESLIDVLEKNIGRKLNDEEVATFLNELKKQNWRQK